MSIRSSAYLALLLAIPLQAQAQSSNQCHIDSFGNKVCNGVVDLSRIGLDGIEAAQQAAESRERVRASQLQRERAAFELQRERERWRVEQEALKAQQARKIVPDTEAPMECKRTSAAEISCEDSQGVIKKYKID